ncbi:hypothetical protein TNCV_646571 [Trichonephila clavipes]|nr:hypothetical protein TNCV_646571 [Trichonephila clavipes]
MRLKARNIPVMGVSKKHPVFICDENLLKLNLLSPVKSTRPHSLSLNFGVPGTTERRYSDGQALKIPTRTWGRPYKQTTPCSLRHGKTRYRSSSRLCRVSSDLLPLSAACFFWPVRQCTSHLRVWFPLVDTTTTEPPDSCSCSLKLSKVVKRCCEQFELCSPTAITAAFLQLLPMIRPRLKASRCRLTD